MVQNRWFPGGSFPSFMGSQFLWSYFPVPTASFCGKTVIVTGANVGLGFEAAKHIARLGASKLILAVRTLEKGEKAKDEIEAETRCGRGVVEVWKLDLSNAESVKQFAARANSELPRIDVLLENAGLATGTFREMEGEESMIKTNVTSTFLLAFLMLPKLKETAKKYDTRPTLTIVSSEVHYWSPFSEGRNAPEGQIWNTINDPSKADMKDRYQLSKLLEIYVVRKMGSLRPNRAISTSATDDYPVTINTVNPGLCHSELAREAGPMSALQIMKKVMARTTEVGSRTLVDAAAGGPVTHGQYLSDLDITEPAKLTTSPEGLKLGDRVYKELCERLENMAPGCTSNL